VTPAHTARAADVSHVTDRQIDTANIGNSLISLILFVLLFSRFDKSDFLHSALSVPAGFEHIEGACSALCFAYCVFVFSFIQPHRQ